jgi:hypothetical protein
MFIKVAALLEDSVSFDYIWYFSYSFRVRPSVLFPSQLIWNYGSYRQSVGLLGRAISPVARPLPTQDNTNTEDTRTDIYASSGIRTHDSSVRASEDILCLILNGHCDRTNFGIVGPN